MASGIQSVMSLFVILLSVLTLFPLLLALSQLLCGAGYFFSVWTSLIFIEHSIQKQQTAHPSSARERLSMIDDMLVHKASLSKFRKIEISSILSVYNTLRLE